MKEHSNAIQKLHGAGQGTLTTYVTGFLLSLLLTLAAYYLVVRHTFSPSLVIGTIAGLGAVQVLVQLLFFLHLGTESKPHWNLLVFSLMVFILAIIVLGTLWIMFNLNDRMMPPMDEVHHYMHRQQGF